VASEGSVRINRRERRLESTRNELIEATLAVITETGARDLSAVTINRVLSEVGMARATLYAHFPDGRESLLAAAYERVAHQFLDKAESVIELNGGTELRWTQRMAAYAEALVALSTDPGIGYFYNISGPQLLGFSKDRGVGSTGVFIAFKKELEVGALDRKLLGPLGEPLAVLLSGSLRDAGIEVALRPDTAAELLSAFRLVLQRLDEAPEAG
jgi:AcrR family transcriptional regulator